MIFDVTSQEDREELWYHRVNHLLGAWLVLTFGDFDFRYLTNLRFHDVVHFLPRRSVDDSAAFRAELLRRRHLDLRVVLLEPREPGVVLPEDILLLREMEPIARIYTTEHDLVCCRNSLGQDPPEIVHLTSSGQPFHPSRPILGPDRKPINRHAAV